MDLPGTIHGLDPPNMQQDVAAVSWKKFCVIVAGKTGGAHRGIVTGLKAIGQTKVKSVEESDYLLVFCAITSPAGTEIKEALDNIPGGKPIILAVMHHIVTSDLIPADNRGQVNNPNVRLTVDFVYYNRQLLPCQRNLTAVNDINRFLGADPSQLSTCSCNLCRARWKLWAFLIGYLLVGLISTVIIIAVIELKKDA